MVETFLQLSLGEDDSPAVCRAPFIQSLLQTFIIQSLGNTQVGSHIGFIAHQVSNVESAPGNPERQSTLTHPLAKNKKLGRVVLWFLIYMLFTYNICWGGESYTLLMCLHSTLPRGVLLILQPGY